MTNESVEKKNSFWSLSRFLIANAVVAALLFFGFHVPPVKVLSGVIAGFYLSGPLVWYFVVTILWWIVIASYMVHLFREKKVDEKFPIVTNAGSWIITLIPSWFLFLEMLRLYIFVNLSG